MSRAILGATDDPGNAPPPGWNAAPERAAQGNAALVGKRAVVVEDEGITQMQLVKILTHLGMKVVGTAVTGESGVDIVLRERPDLVLMDIKMPGRVDGMEASRRILQVYRACIFVITAFDQEEYKAQAEQLGLCGYVTKPVTSDRLSVYLRQALERFYET